jgi:geranylgeranyl diphosphate synthase type I
VPRNGDTPDSVLLLEPRAVGDPLTPIREPVDELLERFMSARAAELDELDPRLAVLGREIAGLIVGRGKRLRPAFVYWGYRAGGGDDDVAVVHVAAAVEMLHTFALLHDDVMDRADTRRGRPVARRGFAAVHAAERLEGDAEWFGTSAAILAGDLAFLWADQLLDAAPSPCLARVRRIFTTLRVEVMAGQYLDLRLEGATSIHPDEARRVALLKSGRYTVTRPLQLGWALTAGPDDAVARALARYGDAIGLAFQLRDDILGLFGDPALTGKSSCDDLRAGKRTLLMLRTLTLASPRERSVLERSLGDRHLDDGAVERCREIVAESGALASVETLLATQLATAVRAVGELPDPVRSALTALAATAVHRPS